MNELNPLYSRLLELGFIVMKLAAHHRDHQWLELELKMLHNVPSLIGEANIHRHVHYWNQERPPYIQAIQASGNQEAISRMRSFYEPIWLEMEPLIAELRKHSEAAT